MQCSALAVDLRQHVAAVETGLHAAGDRDVFPVLDLDFCRGGGFARLRAERHGAGQRKTASECREFHHAEHTTRVAGVELFHSAQARV